MNIKCFLIENTGKDLVEDVIVDGEKRGSRTLSVYKRTDTGEEFTLSQAPVGAIWRAEWFEDCPEWVGPDGKTYVCKTPGGEWIIDSRASNCTLPNDKVHKCWCRHGDAPNFTVDKNGITCSAGAGSIAIRGYHGFLINGELTNC